MVTDARARSAAAPPRAGLESDDQAASGTEERAGGGLFGSVRRLGGTLLETAEVRLELIGTEVEREKLRIARGLLLAAAGTVLCVAALLLLSAAFVMMAEPAQRLAVMLVLGLCYALIAAWLLYSARGALRAPPDGAFALSRAELRRDRDALRPPAA